MWEPDTHPGHVLHTHWDVEKPEADHSCFRAVVDGVEQPDPQAVYNAVLFENRLKNRAEAAIVDAMPQTMKREVLDDDGDPTGEWIVKTKHQPVWDYGAADGKITFTVPGASALVIEAINLALAPFGDAVTLG